MFMITGPLSMTIDELPCRLMLLKLYVPAVRCSTAPPVSFMSAPYNGLPAGFSTRFPGEPLQLPPPKPASAHVAEEVSTMLPVGGAGLGGAGVGYVTACGSCT